MLDEVNQNLGKLKQYNDLIFVGKTNFNLGDYGDNNVARYEGILVSKEVGARKRYIGGIYQRGSKDGYPHTVMHIDHIFLRSTAGIIDTV